MQKNEQKKDLLPWHSIVLFKGKAVDSLVDLKILHNELNKLKAKACKHFSNRLALSHDLACRQMVLEVHAHTGKEFETEEKENRSVVPQFIRGYFFDLKFID